MTYTPRRKHGLHGLPKVLFYSSTLLSVTSSYAAPIVNVVADTKTLTDIDDSKEKFDPSLKPETNSAKNTQKIKSENAEGKSSRIEPQSEEPSISPLIDYTYPVEYHNFVDDSIVGNGTVTCAAPPGSSVSYTDMIFGNLPVDSTTFDNSGRTCQLPSDGSTLKIRVRLNNMTFHIKCVDENGDPLKDPDGNVYPASTVAFDKTLRYDGNIMESVEDDDLPAELKKYFFVEETFTYNQSARNTSANQTIKLALKNKTTVKFQDMNTNNFLPSSTNVDLWGDTGDIVDISDRVPSGYVLANNSFKDVTIGTPEVAVLVKKVVSCPVQFVDATNPSINIGSPQTISGPEGDSVADNNITVKPSLYGYRYSGGSFPNNITFQNGSTIKIPVEFDNNVTNKIKFIDQNNPADTFDNTQTTSGKYDDPVHLGSINVPTDYRIDNSMPVPTYVENNGTINVFIRKAIYTNKIDFTLNGVPTLLVPSQTITGAENQIIPFDPNWIPSDYELNGTPPTLSIVANDNHHYTVDLKVKTPTPINVTNQIRYVDQDNNQIGSDYAVTGLPGSTIPSSTLIAHIPDAHYELDPSQGNAIMGLEGTVIKVKVKLKSYNYNLYYEDNGTVVGSTVVNAVFNTLAKTKIENNIPSGYKLKNPSSINSLIFGDDQDFHIQVEIDNGLPVKNKLDYKVDGTGLSIGVVEVGPETIGTTISRSDLENKNPDSAHYELKASQGSLTYLTEGAVQDVTVVPKSLNYSIVYKTADGNVVSTASVTGTYNTNAKSAIDDNKPGGYSYSNPTTINNTVFSNDSTIVVEVTRDPISVKNKLDYKVDGTGLSIGVVEVGPETMGTTISRSDLEDKNPDSAHYELKASQGSLTYLTEGAVQDVTVVPKSLNYSIVYKTTDGHVVSTASVTGTYNTSAKTKITSNKPSGYTFVNQTDVNNAVFKNNSTLNVMVARNSVPTPPRPTPPAPIPPVPSLINNYIQFKVDGLYYGSKITITRAPNSTIDLLPYIPNDFELESGVNKTITMGHAEKVHYIDIKRKEVPPAPTPELNVNFFQFVMGENYVGEKIKVIGDAGFTIDLRSILPDGYELEEGVNPIATLGSNGIVNYVSVQKKSITNYIQFTVDGSNFGTSHKVNGKLGSTIDVASLIPSGYKLADKNKIIKIEAGNPTHVIALKKVDPTPITNYIQFTVDGLNFETKKTVTGSLGKQIELASLIPAGYELVNPDTSLTIGLDGITQNVAIRKIKNPVTSVNNYIQFTIDGVNYSIKIKRTGQIGDPIDVSTWVPGGYELVDKNSEVFFEADGTIHSIAITKTVQTLAALTNYIQFTVDGIALGNPIRVSGSIGETIDIDDLIPEGYALANPSSSFSIGLDYSTQFVELIKIDDSDEVFEEDNDVLPQLGEQNNKATTVGLIGLAGAAAATAAKLKSSKRKKNTDN